MTILSHDTIVELCTGVDPIVIDADTAQVRTASYDLRLGDEYYLSNAADGGDGALQIQRLGPDRKALEIPANQVVLVRTRENIAMRRNLVGHLSLKLDVLMKGLIMSSQSQIDAGYRGAIYALLYNLSDKPATVKLDESLLRLEFAELDMSTRPYEGDYKEDFTLADVVKERLTSSLQSLAASVRATRRIAVIGGLSLIAAIIAMIYPIFVPFAHDASDAKAAVEKRQDDLRTLEAQLEAERSQLLDAERRLAMVEERLRAPAVAHPNTMQP